MKKTLILVAAAALLVAVLLSGCGAKSVTWEDYQAWLIDTFAATSPNPDGLTELINSTKSWDDIDLTTEPWNKMFSEENYNASTWEEFQADGKGSYNEAYVDAFEGGEPTGEPSGEPSGEITTAE